MVPLLVMHAMYKLKTPQATYACHKCDYNYNAYAACLEFHTCHISNYFAILQRHLALRLGARHLKAFAVSCQASFCLPRKKYFSFKICICSLFLLTTHTYTPFMRVMPPKLPASNVTLFFQSCVSAPHDAKGLLHCCCCTATEPTAATEVRSSQVTSGLWVFPGRFQYCIVVAWLVAVVFAFVFVYVQFGVVWWRCLLATSIICQPFFQQFTHLFRGLSPNELFATRLQLRLCDVVTVVAGQWHAACAWSGPTVAQRASICSDM